MNYLNRFEEELEIAALCNDEEFNTLLLEVEEDHKAFLDMHDLFDGV